MVLMFPFLTNVITILSMARLTFVYHSHQNMSVKYGITVKQMFKILKNLLKTLIGEKLLNPFFFYYINEWNNLNAEVRNAKSIHILKKMFITKKGKLPFFCL